MRSWKKLYHIIQSHVATVHATPVGIYTKKIFMYIMVCK